MELKSCTSSSNFPTEVAIPEFHVILLYVLMHKLCVTIFIWKTGRTSLWQIVQNKTNPVSLVPVWQNYFDSMQCILVIA